MVSYDMLFGGIIALVIGIILFAIRTYIPPVATKFAEIGGIILSILGILLIVLSVVLPYIPLS